MKVICYLTAALLLGACNKTGSVLTLVPSVHWYAFNSYEHDTTYVGSFKLNVVISGKTVKMYSDTAMTHLEYEGQFINDTLAKLKYIPSPVSSFGVFKGSACTMTFWDFTYKGEML